MSLDDESAQDGNTAKARDILLRGRRYTSDEQEEADQEAWREEYWLVEDYFRNIRASSVEFALAEFEYSNDVLHRWESAKLLIAYFVWCGKRGVETVPDKDGKAAGSVDSYIVRFSQVAFSRIGGFPANGWDGENVPKWTRPDMAFGLEKLRGGQQKDEGRNVAIAAYVEYFRRQGKSAITAQEDAVGLFFDNPDGGTAAVRKACTDGNRIYGKRFGRFSDEELKEVFAEFLDRK